MDLGEVVTTERAEKEGMSLQKALTEFADALELSKMVVAHNISFDEKVMGAEFLRKEQASKLFERAKICTMHESTDYCAIQSDFGYKWPKLMELHKKLFNEEFDDAHDALADVKACAKCFFEMVNRKII